MSQPYERQLERLAYGENWDLTGLVQHANDLRALRGHVSGLIAGLESTWEGRAAEIALSRLRTHQDNLDQTVEVYDKALMEITGSSSMTCGMTMGANTERQTRAENHLKNLPGFLPSWLHNAVNKGGTVEYEGTTVSKANGALEWLEAQASGKREAAAQAAVGDMYQTVDQLSYRLTNIVSQLDWIKTPPPVKIPGPERVIPSFEDDGPGRRGVDGPIGPDGTYPDGGDGTGSVAPPDGFPGGPGIPGIPGGPGGPSVPGIPGGPDGPGGDRAPDIGGPGVEPGRPGMPGPAPSDPPRIEMPQPRLPYPGVDGPTVPGTNPPPSIDIPGGPAYPDYPGGEGDTGVDSDMGGGTTNRPGSGLLPGVGAGGALAVGSKAAGGAGSLGTGPGGIFGGSGAAGAGGVGGIGGAPGAGGAAGPGALAGRSGGLLGGVGGAGGGSGGTGAGGSGAGGTGSGGRPMGMMGAPMGGANNGKKQRGAGLGYLAPHLEDEGERGPASDISRAGSRETPEEPFFAE